MLPRLLLFCLMWLLAQPASAECVIHLILSGSAPAYQEAAEAFRGELGPRCATRVWSAGELAPTELQNLTRGADLVMPVGVGAARLVAEQHGVVAPILSLMLPRAAAERLYPPVASGRRKASFVYIDQPARRSLGLIEAAFPGARRVGMLVSPENAAVAKNLGQEAARRRLALNLEYVDSADDVAPALRRVLAESDVLLLVPDTLAINAANARNVLMATYRQRVPVVGFSQGLSKAGAVASAYSSPAQIGRQGARMAARWLESGELPPHQAAAEFSIDFNRHVARSLGVTLPDEGEIRRGLGATE
jgi:ABC-type uncharacterized transport system substrate-binding protein